MDNTNWNFNPVNQPGLAQKPLTRSFISGVFSWMGIALANPLLLLMYSGTTWII
ncbi:MAG: hypothetical protein IT242_02915 [Bacteroidia bacterium]|nr:hypothetical protein [Bacteroidia bacterium]